MYTLLMFLAVCFVVYFVLFPVCLIVGLALFAVQFTISRSFEVLS